MKINEILVESDEIFFDSPTHDIQIAAKQAFEKNGKVIRAPGGTFKSVSKDDPRPRVIVNKEYYEKFKPLDDALKQVRGEMRRKYNAQSINYHNQYAAIPQEEPTGPHREYRELAEKSKRLVAAIKKLQATIPNYIEVK